MLPCWNRYLYQGLDDSKVGMKLLGVRCELEGWDKWLLVKEAENNKRR